MMLDWCFLLLRSCFWSTWRPFLPTKRTRCMSCWRTWETSPTWSPCSVLPRLLMQTMTCVHLSLPAALRNVVASVFRRRSRGPKRPQQGERPQPAGQDPHLPHSHQQVWAAGRRRQRLEDSDDKVSSMDCGGVSNAPSHIQSTYPEFDVNSVQNVTVRTEAKVSRRRLIFPDTPCRLCAYLSPPFLPLYRFLCFKERALVVSTISSINTSLYSTFSPKAAVCSEWNIFFLRLSSCQIIV